MLKKKWSYEGVAMFTTKEGLEVASDNNKPKHVSHDLILKNSRQVLFSHVSPTAPANRLKIGIEPADLMAFDNYGELRKEYLEKLAPDHYEENFPISP